MEKNCVRYGRVTFLIPLVSVLLFIAVLMTDNAHGLVGYIQSDKDGPYTIVFTDEAENTVTGEFKNPLMIEWDEQEWGKKKRIKILDWDKEATFIYEDNEGKRFEILNRIVRRRISYISPNFWGKLKGDIRDAIKE